MQWIDIKLYAMILVRVVYTSWFKWSSIGYNVWPCRAFSDRWFIVLHRLMDRESIMLFIWWFREILLIVGSLRALLITCTCTSWCRLCPANSIVWWGVVRFKPSVVHDWIISIRQLSFHFWYSLSSLWIYFITITSMIVHNVIWQGKMFSHWFFNSSVLDVWSMACQTNADCMLCFSDIVNGISFALNQIFCITSSTVRGSFHMKLCYSCSAGRALLRMLTTMRSQIISPPHVSLVAIFCEITEGYDVLLCSFAALLAPLVESGTLVYGILPGLEEQIELRLPCTPCFPCLLHSLMLELLLLPPPTQQSKILTCFVSLDSSRPKACLNCWNWCFQRCQSSRLRELKGSWGWRQIPAILHHYHHVVLSDWFNEDDVSNQEPWTRTELNSIELNLT